MHHHSNNLSMCNCHFSMAENFKSPRPLHDHADRCLSLRISNSISSGSTVHRTRQLWCACVLRERRVTSFKLLCREYLRREDSSTALTSYVSGLITTSHYLGYVNCWVCMHGQRTVSLILSRFFDAVNSWAPSLVGYWKRSCPFQRHQS
jgi:hypothetical protein